MLTRLDRILLSRQAKCIPTHRVEHVVVIHFFIPTQNICGGVSLWVTNVKSRTGWIGEHIEDEILRFASVKIFVTRVGGAEGLGSIPVVLPFGFKLVEGERFTLIGHENVGVQSLVGRRW